MRLNGALTPAVLGAQAQLLRRANSAQRKGEEREWIRGEEVLAGLGVEQLVNPDATG